MDKAAIFIKTRESDQTVSRLLEIIHIPYSIVYFEVSSPARVPVPVPVLVPGPIAYDDERDTAFDQICKFNSDRGERRATQISRWFFAVSQAKAAPIAE